MEGTIVWTLIHFMSVVPLVIIGMLMEVYGSSTHLKVGKVMFSDLPKNIFQLIQFKQLTGLTKV